MIVARSGGAVALLARRWAAAYAGYATSSGSHAAGAPGAGSSSSDAPGGACSSSVAPAAAPPPPCLVVLPMPKLSPEMQVRTLSTPCLLPAGDGPRSCPEEASAR